MRKYGNKKITIDGITFDSLKEGKRYQELKLLLKAGIIQDLKLQVPFVLLTGVKYENERAKPPLKYIADFVYIENGKEIIEDVKGMKTDMFKVKRHMMKVLLQKDIKIT